MGVSVYQFSSDGLLESSRVYFDAGTLLSQLGVAQLPARAIEPLPSGAPTETTVAGTDSEQRNVNAVKKMLAAFGAHNEVDFLAGLSDDIVWDDMAQPATMRGKDAARATFEAMTTAFPDAEVTIQALWGAGDYVICESTLTGTHSGPLGPIPATNRPIDLHGLDILEFDSAGQIVRGRSYNNSLELLMQLGLLSAESPAD